MKSASSKVERSPRAEEAKRLFDFVKLLHDTCIDLSRRVTFNKSFLKDGLVVCLYGTLIEQTGSFIALAERKRRAGCHSIFRSFFEAYVDFVNLNEDPNYASYCFAQHHEQWAKALNASHGDNPYLKGIAEHSERDAALQRHESELKRLKDEGFRPLTVFERFKKAGMELEYRSIYNFESGQAHNGITALIARHLSMGDKGFELEYYKDTSIADFLVHLDSLAGLLLSATKRLHSRLKSNCNPELKRLEEQLNEIRNLYSSVDSKDMLHRYRSHTCGALREGDIGKSVRLSGWVHRVRDHGGVLFIDLRDHYGLTQVVADPDSKAFKLAETLRAEWVVRVDGNVRHRPAGTENADLPTGQVEVYIDEIEVLGPAAELPMPVFGEQDYPEDIRLKYRFLDLRRDKLHKNIMLRGQVIDSIRRRMKEGGFFEFQTPILTASSPEGARDFLVPSRLHPGKFYALPQAPQQFKQLIMVAGFDRYFQIAPCFRDEDARADRSPGEFYQLDLEMSFVTQQDVFDAVEPVIRGVFEEFGAGKPVTPKFPLIPYAEALSKYGTDKPDLRNPIVMQDVSEAFRGSGFKIFANILAGDPKAAVWAIPAPKGGNRAFCDRMNSWAQGEGQPGLGYIFWREGEEGGAGPLAKNIGPERTKMIADQLGLGVGDAVFFVAGQPAKFVKFAGPARTKVGEELGLIAQGRYDFCWIVDFPMFEWSEEEKKIDFSHNPFSMPNMSVEEFVALDPNDHEKLLAIKAIQYDIVCNGTELSSGAIRNHRPEVMKKAFAICGYGEDVLEAKFGGMLHALSLGAPPHGGIAPGIDRIVMLLAGEDNIREVTLFPMNQRAEDLMMGAPSEVTAKQLKELHIRLELPKKA